MDTLLSYFFSFHFSTYSIAFSKLLRPSSLYSIVTSFHEQEILRDGHILWEGDVLRGHATLSASVSSEQGEVAAGSVEILMSQSSTLSLPVGAIPSYNSLVEVTTRRVYCRRHPLPSNPLKEILL